tara:strand:- start:3713 stop:3817 length:105 start_codon:yes stop_codon:yes gene_type:complete
MRNNMLQNEEDFIANVLVGVTIMALITLFLIALW